jgi:predicted enzyme related to lactoylglutathione lyase
MPQLNFILTAQDAARARAFYERALGAKTAWAAPDGTWSVMRLGRSEFCIEGNGTGELTNTGFAVEVDDLEQALAAVEQAGGKVYRASDHGHVVITDTEGNRFTMVGAGGCSMHSSKFPEPASATAQP